MASLALHPPLLEIAMSRLELRTFDTVEAWRMFVGTDKGVVHSGIERAELVKDKSVRVSFGITDGGWF